MRREVLIFRAAVTVAAVHAVDDAFVSRQAGVGPGEHVVAGLLALVATVAALVAFPRLRPGVRSALALSFGAFALANGMQHVIAVGTTGVGRADVTGVAAALAGVVLVVLGVAIPFAHRGERPGRLWLRRVLVVVAGLLVFVFLVIPVSVAITTTHKYREAVGEKPGPVYREVAFRSSDGLRLRGWYVPSRNRAAVIVLHGGGGDRTGATQHAQLLARAGYGVLLYDARGRGESEGSPNALGWSWPKDVAGALSFLRAQPDVDPKRIGGLGLSTGADVLIEVAAHDRSLGAVIADGATGRSSADVAAAGLDPATSLNLRSVYAAVRVLSGDSPGPPERDLVRQLAPTPLLLIAASKGPMETELGEVYARAAGDGADYWPLPGVHHTAAIRERPAEYRKRVLTFFRNALQPTT